MYPVMAYHMTRSRVYKKIPFDEVNFELDTMKHDNSCSIEMINLDHISNDVILHFAITDISIKCSDTNLVFYQSHIESSKPITAIVNGTELQISNGIQYNKIYVPFPKTAVTITILDDTTNIKFGDQLLIDYKNICVKINNT